jgi:NAD(P)-dependent dehydrogenase (short-subunit alcohol dehydrogenase family)
MDRRKEFEGKAVLVTGAGRSPGKAIAERFAGFGAIVAAHDLTPVNLDLTLDTIQEAGGRAKGFISDLSKKMPAQLMVDQVLDEIGRIDVLVNACTVHPKKDVLVMDEWDWRHTLDMNLSAAFFLTQVVGRVMREQGGGVIVHIAGVDRVELRGSAASMASIMGVAGLTRASACELNEHDIRVHAILLGDPGIQLGPSAEVNLPVPPGGGGQAFSEEELVVAWTLYCCSQASESQNGLVIHASMGDAGR